MGAPTLSSVQLLEIRTDYIRDLYVAAQPSASPPVVGQALSRFNQTTLKNFVDDGALQRISDREWYAHVPELTEAYNSAYADNLRLRLEAGDDETTAEAAADTAATSVQNATLYSYITAAVKKLMVADTVYRATMYGEQGSDKVAKEYLDSSEQAAQPILRFIKTVRG